MSNRRIYLFIAGLLSLGASFYVYRTDFDQDDLRMFLHGMGVQANGHIRNASSKPVWVTITRYNRAYVYRLEPGQQSPASVDADAVKSLDKTPIQGDTAWYKVLDGTTGTVRNDGAGLRMECYLCYPEHRYAFHHPVYADTTRWGVPF